MGQSFQLEFPSTSTLLLCQASCRVYPHFLCWQLQERWTPGGVTWGAQPRNLSRGKTAGRLDEDLGGICRRTKWWVCKKEQTHTEDVKPRSKEGHLQNTPCPQHTERTTASSPAPGELLASFESMWWPCRSSSLPRSALCHDCKHEDGSLFQKAA